MPSSGDRLNQFELLEPLGKGGMGEVFLARDTTLERKVAIKFLPETLKTDRAARERFLRESKLAAALDHPYVCKVYEVGDIDGKSFIAMEYVEGETLHERLRKGPLRLGLLLELGAEIAEAIEAAHQKQIVHRDLKTTNIMLTPEEHVKVLDFGVAKHLAMDAGAESDASTFSGRLTSADTTPGTVIYMSPEQVRGEPLDARTDLFSLGVVLYEMATWSVPFQGATSGMTYDAILNRGPASIRSANPDVPVELERIVLKALEKDRDHRYQSAKEMVVDLRRLKRDSTTSIPSVSGTHPAAAAAPKTKGPWGVIAALGAVALLALGVLVLAPSVDAPAESIDSLAVLPFERTLELDPMFPATHTMLTDGYWYAGMIDEAVGQAQHVDEVTARYFEALARQDLDAAITVVDESLDLVTSSVTSSSSRYAMAGAKDKAFDVLEQAVRERSAQVLLGQNRVAFDPYRSAPRFIAIRESIGLDP